MIFRSLYDTNVTFSVKILYWRLKKIFWKRENQNLHYSDFTHIFSVTILQKKKNWKRPEFQEVVFKYLVLMFKLINSIGLHKYKHLALTEQLRGLKQHNI